MAFWRAWNRIRNFAAQRSEWGRRVSSLQVPGRKISNRSGSEIYSIFRKFHRKLTFSGFGNEHALSENMSNLKSGVNPTVLDPDPIGDGRSWPQFFASQVPLFWLLISMVLKMGRRNSGRRSSPISTSFERLEDRVFLSSQSAAILPRSVETKGLDSPIPLEIAHLNRGLKGKSFDATRVETVSVNLGFVGSDHVDEIFQQPAKQDYFFQSSDGLIVVGRRQQKNVAWIGVLQPGGELELHEIRRGSHTRATSPKGLAAEKLKAIATAIILQKSPVLHAPMAMDDNGTVTAGGQTTIDVLGNDTDADNIPPITANSGLVVTGIGPAGHGSVLLSTGVVSYTPYAGYSGADQFTYSIADSTGRTLLLGPTLIYRLPIITDSTVSRS
jgi:hypothetical protein